METEPSHILIEPASGLAAQSTTPPPFESTQQYPAHHEEDTVAQADERATHTDKAEINDYLPTRSGPERSMQGELTPSLILENGNVSTTPTEELPPKHLDFSKLSRFSFRHELILTGQAQPLSITGAESRPMVVLREQRTQEELKAIEALEELSRQKSVGTMPPPPEHMISRGETVHRREVIPHTTPDLAAPDTRSEPRDAGVEPEAESPPALNVPLVRQESSQQSKFRHLFFFFLPFLFFHL